MCLIYSNMYKFQSICPSIILCAISLRKPKKHQLVVRKPPSRAAKKLGNQTTLHMPWRRLASDSTRPLPYLKNNRTPRGGHPNHLGIFLNLTMFLWWCEHVFTVGMFLFGDLWKGSSHCFPFQQVLVMQWSWQFPMENQRFSLIFHGKIPGNHVISPRPGRAPPGG